MSVLYAIAWTLHELLTWSWSTMGGSLPERVAQIYYTYGLFCSSYPVTVISIALTVVLMCWWVNIVLFIFKIPVPGKINNLLYNQTIYFMLRNSQTISRGKIFQSTMWLDKNISKSTICLHVALRSCQLNTKEHKHCCYLCVKLPVTRSRFQCSLLYFPTELYGILSSSYLPTW